MSKGSGSRVSNHEAYRECPLWEDERTRSTIKDVHAITAMNQDREFELVPVHSKIENIAPAGQLYGIRGVPVRQQKEK